jgi:nitrate reductase gamma subunit
MSYFHTFFFELYPYLAGSVFLIGSLVRFDRDQYTWKADSSQMLRKKSFRLASNLFHVGILLLFVGHFVGLLTPPEVYHAFGLSAPVKQVLSMVAGGIFGLMMLVGLTLLLRRRLTEPRVRANTTRMDFFILLLLYAQLLLGLFTIPASMYHLDGANMVLMATWAQHIVTFRGDAAQFLVGVPLLYQLHIVLGLTIFLVFPFSRLVHIWSAPVWYLGRRGYQIVRQR